MEHGAVRGPDFLSAGLMLAALAGAALLQLGCICCGALAANPSVRNFGERRNPFWLCCCLLLLLLQRATTSQDQGLPSASGRVTFFVLSHKESNGGVNVQVHHPAPAGF
ncbi:hypothetical protein GLE_3146 [Lysobacter enzymogenes]|uniref:Uncharacterized protein n=1 Tax=Lysobacter enzymogenes TaxID=69 RepID=A0A0S2DJB9_LYSEN|nr:hypothetical protein GLE_3146 [Lysobacter enzymogenes]